MNQDKQSEVIESDLRGEIKQLTEVVNISTALLLGLDPQAACEQIDATLSGDASKATFTISVFEDRTSVKTQGGSAGVPAEMLDAAIFALEHEREKVGNCPRQRALSRPSPSTPSEGVIERELANQLWFHFGSIGRSAQYPYSDPFWCGKARKIVERLALARLSPLPLVEEGAEP